MEKIINMVPPIFLFQEYRETWPFPLFFDKIIFLAEFLQEDFSGVVLFIPSTPEARTRGWSESSVISILDFGDRRRGGVQDLAWELMSVQLKGFEKRKPKTRLTHSAIPTTVTLASFSP